MSARWQGQLCGILESRGMEMAYSLEPENEAKAEYRRGFLAGIGYAMTVINLWQKLGLQPRGKDET